jgi:hypothetical protein
MTIQIKHFIELADILSVRFTCIHCEATLSLPISDIKLKTGAPSNSGFINKCPGCGRPWADLNGSSYESEIVKFTKSLNALKAAMCGDEALGYKPAPLSFSLSVEVSRPIQDVRPVTPLPL